MSMQRRDFLTTIGAASAVAVIPGCATMSGASGKVVVIGGGYGGATAAKYIRMWSDGGVDVTLVEPNPEFISCPISNLVLGGSKTLADVKWNRRKASQVLGISYKTLLNRMKECALVRH